MGVKCLITNKIAPLDERGDFLTDLKAHFKSCRAHRQFGTWSNYNSGLTQKKVFVSTSEAFLLDVY